MRRQKLLSAVDLLGSWPTAKQSASVSYPLQFLAYLAGAVQDNETGKLLEYRHLIKHPKYKKYWGYSFGDYIGRLAQGIPVQNTATNTIFFIHKGETPNELWKDVSYSRIDCNELPQKEEVNQTRLTFGGDNLRIDTDCRTPTASLLRINLMLNSIILTPGEKFLGLDLKDLYLNTPMDRPEFLRIILSNFPEDVIKHYKLREKVDNKGFV